MNRSEQVVIITGGNSGIGKALAIKYGAQGAKIVLTGRNLDRLEEIKSTLSAMKVEHLALKADAASEADNQMLVEKTIEHFGRIDTLICNA